MCCWKYFLIFYKLTTSSIFSPNSLHFHSSSPHTVSFVINSIYKHLVSSDPLMIMAQILFVHQPWSLIFDCLSTPSFPPLTPFPPPPQILKLSYNKLREISSSLTFSGLTSLLRLYLDHNLLQHIHPRALLQLPSLRLLRLQGNRLHQLHPHTLCTLSLLNTYYFSTLRWALTLKRM